MRYYVLLNKRDELDNVVQMLCYLFGFVKSIKLSLIALRKVEITIYIYVIIFMCRGMHVNICRIFFLQTFLRVEKFKKEIAGTLKYLLFFLQF